MKCDGDKMTFFRLEMYSFVKFTLPLSTKGRNGRMVERKKIEIPRNRNECIDNSFSSFCDMSFPKHQACCILKWSFHLPTSPGIIHHTM